MNYQDFINNEITRVAFGLFCMVIAYFKGRRLLLWGLLGYSGTVLTLAILLIRKVLPRRYYPTLANFTMWLAERSVAKRMKEIETPDDFLREADGKEK